MSITFGYVSCWAKGSLKTLIEEDVQLTDGIMMSGKVSLKPEQAQELIEYLSDPANCGKYGIELDLSLFYSEDKKVKIGGKLTTPFSKGDSATAKTSTTSKARRTV